MKVYRLDRETLPPGPDPCSLTCFQIFTSQECPTRHRQHTHITRLFLQFSSVQSLSHVRLFATPWTTACPASLSNTNSWNLPKPMSIESVMPSNHLILCCPLLLLPSIFPSIRIFSNESALCIRWPKYWSLSFNISSSNENLGLISFRMDWLDLLAFQGTLKSLLQHHSWKASLLWQSAFFIVQLSHPYMTTGKTIALMRWTFVDKVMSLLLNMLSRLVIAFLSRSKRHSLEKWNCSGKMTADTDILTMLSLSSQRRSLPLTHLSEGWQHGASTHILMPHSVKNAKRKDRDKNREQEPHKKQRQQKGI